MLQNLLEDFDNSGNQSLREARRFLNIYEDIFKKNIPVYLMFDLLSDGHFTTSSRLYYVLGEKIGRDIGADFPPHKRKLLFEFDNSINVQMIWALFSILNYWDTYYITFLNSFTEAIFDQHGIDLHEDEGLIKYLAMRMDSTDFEELKELLAIAEDSGKLLYEIELSEIFKTCKHMSLSEKPIYILKKFIRGKYFKGINDGLFDYLKKNLPNDYWTSHSDFVRLLQKSPVSSLSEVEECMDKIDKKLTRIEKDYQANEKQNLLKDLERINELIALEHCEEDVRQLKKRKMYLMAALTALQPGGCPRIAPVARMAANWSKKSEIFSE